MAFSVIGCCGCDLRQTTKLCIGQDMSLEVLLALFNLHYIQEDRSLDELNADVLQTSVYGSQ